MKATVNLQLSYYNEEQTKRTDLRDVRGFVLARRPGFARIQAQYPVTRQKAFDMASDGETFQVYLVWQGRFFTGSNAMDQPSKKRAENIRPQHIVEPLLIEAPRPDETAVLDNITEGRTPYHVVQLQRELDGTAEITRKFWFNRADLRLSRLEIYDPDANVVTIARYSGWQTEGPIPYPAQASVLRPVQGLQPGVRVSRARAQRGAPRKRISARTARRRRGRDRRRRLRLARSQCGGPLVAPGDKPILQVEDLQKVYHMGEIDVPALRGVTLRIDPGEFVAILGPSGSGKSTLFHVVGGLTPPTSGRVLIDGRDLAKMSDRQRTELRKRSVGFVFQKFNLLPTLTARENIEIARDIAGVKDPLTEQFLDVVRLLGIDRRLGHKPYALSGGEQQRVAIARAIVNNPPLLLADEPTGNLDSRNSEVVLETLKKLNRELGQTILMITHNPEAAKFAAARQVQMRDGRIVSDQ